MTDVAVKFEGVSKKYRFFALDNVHAHRRRVEQQVDDVIVEQVHFIDV